MEQGMIAYRAGTVDAEAPREVLVSPWGEVVSTNGTFVMDEEAGRLVIEAFTRHATDLPVDYEHQTLGGEYASPSGQAPAAGWIRKLSLVVPGEIKPPGLYAEIEWTQPAREQIAARQYRYLSPVAMVRRCDRRMTTLHSVALTNKPAIVGMQAIVNRNQNVEEPVDGNEEDQRMTEAVERLRTQLAMEVGSDAECVLTAASERLAAMELESKRRDAESCVVAAMQSGKLTEAQREWALTLAMRDREAFDQWQSSAPVVVCVGRTSHQAGNTAERDRERLAAKARAEYRRHPELATLTSEDAYVAAALRDGGCAD